MILELCWQRNIQKKDIEVHQKNIEPWNITLADTGIDTASGGRVKRIEKYVDDTFCMTYGDGLTNSDIGICPK